LRSDRGTRTLTGSMSAWKRTWWVVFAANLITSIGMMSFLPFFPSILTDLGVADEEARKVWAGVLFGAAPLAAAIMGPIWGSIGDRYGRKIMVVRALLAITLFVGAMGFAKSPWVLLALRLGQGIFSGFIPPSITLVSVGAPRELQGRVTSSLQAALPAGMILGPVVGELIASLAGTSQVFFFVAALAGTSALAVALLAREDPSSRLTLEPFSTMEFPWGSLLSGAWGDLRLVLANARIQLALLVLFVEQFALGATNPLLEIHAEHLLGALPGEAARQTSWLFSGLAIAGVIATPLWGRFGDRFGHERALCLSVVSSGLLLGLHAAARTFSALLVLRVSLGATTPGANVASFGIAALETGEDRRGGAMGAVFSARALAVSIGASLGGALSSLLGIRGLFLASGVGVLLLLLGFRRRAPGS
jgi:DHA1 family multidrug resistance protein-like MFS transporter